MAEYQHITHESVLPFYDADSQVLILGSLPSVKSREAGFYYMHRTNRFFAILASLFQEETPQGVENRKAFLQRHHIALFDVVWECDIKGSADSTIKNVVVNDFSWVKKTKIKQVFTTGNLAYQLYAKYVSDKVISLPSPSAANAAMSLSVLTESYRVILPYLIENDKTQ